MKRAPGPLDGSGALFGFMRGYRCPSAIILGNQEVPWTELLVGNRNRLVRGDAGVVVLFAAFNYQPSAFKSLAKGTAEPSAPLRCVPVAWCDTRPGVMRPRGMTLQSAVGYRRSG